MSRRKSKYDGYFQAGQKFGNWTVVSGDVSLDERGRATVLCHCSCSPGRSHVSCRHLLTGKSQRCKQCNYSKRHRTDNPNWRGSNHVPKSVLTKISQSCANSGTAYNLDLNSVTTAYASTGGTCTFTGYPITPGEDASLVRLEPNKGYVLGNIIWAHNTVADSVDELGAKKFQDVCYSVYNATHKKRSDIWSQKQR